MAIVVGTNGADDLDGTANNDLIIAGNGDDTIDGGDGHDLIFAGNGDDTVDGGDGNDVIVAGNGDDTVDGGDGHDLIFGGRGDDTIMGGDGNDLIFGGSGDDTIDGGAGSDIISAGKGDDLVIFDVDENAGAQNYFSGGSGNDTLRLRLTQAQFNEMTAAGVFAAFASHVGSHTGFDFSTFGLSFPLNLKVWYFEQIEIELTGSPGLFTNGDDTVDFNTVVAGTYQDGTQYDGLDGNDTVTLADNAAAAAAAGFVVGTAFNAGAGDDTVTGGALDDVINGDAGNDVLNGGTGVDMLNGGDDDDRLILEDINVGDSVDGGAGDDTFVFAAANGSDHDIQVTSTQVIADGIAISVTNVENYEITGADGNDILTGAAGNDFLSGESGNDSLFAGTGIDNIEAGAGNDTVSIADLNGDTADGGVDIDIILFNLNSGQSVNFDLTTGAASLVGGVGNGTFTNFENASFFGPGAATISGTGGNNSLFVRGTGNTVSMLGGDDFVDLFAGGNFIDGGAGNFDSMRYNTADDAIVDLSAGTTDVGGVAGTVMGIESVRTGTGDDEIIGDSGNNNLAGSAGNDTISGGDGNDLLRGDDGEDTLIADAGDDNLDGGAGDDRLILADLSAGDVVDGGADNDTLVYVAALGANHTITGTDVDFTVDGTTIPLVLKSTATDGGWIRGLVVDHQANPVPDAKVCFAGRVFTTGMEGRFTIPRMDHYQTARQIRKMLRDKLL